MRHNTRTVSKYYPKTFTSQIFARKQLILSLINQDLKPGESLYFFSLIPCFINAHKFGICLHPPDFLLLPTFWQKCCVVMLKTSRHMEAFLNWAWRICSCRLCCSQRSRSCWIKARSSSWALSAWSADRPRTTEQNTVLKYIFPLTIVYFWAVKNLNRT